jgi:hypothetical protein
VISPWRARAATKRDRALLAKFVCADARHRWSVEVEQFIRDQVLDWALAEGAAEDDPRLLLVLDRRADSLIGVAAHERVFLGTSDAEKISATKLYVVAVSSAWQGKRFATGERASDVVMSAAMADIAARRPPRDARVYGVVHEDNVKSLALCRRHGLVHELDRNERGYIRLVTEHRARTP